MTDAPESTVPIDQGRLRAVAGLILGGVALAAPLAVYFGSKTLPMIGILTAIAALTTTLFARSEGRIRHLPIFAGILLILPLWAFASALWALDIEFALQGAAKLLGSIVMIFCLLHVAGSLKSQDRKPIESGILIGFALLATMAFTDATSGGTVGNSLYGHIATRDGLAWLHSSAMMLSLMIWPIGVILLRRNCFRIFIVLYGLVILLNWMISYGTGLVVVSVSALCAAVSWFLTRLSLKVLMIGTACAILAMPTIVLIKPPAGDFAAQKWVSNSALHRLHIWDFATSLIVEHPIRGWGMNAARLAPGGKDRAADSRGDHGERLPLHPHNASLQIWLELGLVGALASAAFCVLFFLKLLRSRLDDRSKAMIVGQSASMLIVVWAGFGIWQSWLLAVFGLTTAWMTAVLAVNDQTNAAE